MLLEEEQERQQGEIGNLATHLPQFLYTDLEQRILGAGNPTTPSQWLEQLAQDEDQAVRQAVAQNPNTPWKALEFLGQEFPHAFFANPIGPLQLISQPQEVRADERFWSALL